MSAAVNEKFEKMCTNLHRCALAIGLSLKEDVSYKYLRMAYCSFVLFMMVSYVLCIINSILIDWTELIGVLFLVEISQAISKLIVYAQNKPKIMSLLQKIRKFRSTKISSDVEIEICKKVTLTSYRIFSITWSCYVTNLLNVFITPLVMAKSFIVPTPFLLPIISEDNSLFFEINFTYQFICQLMIISSIILVDTLFLAMLQEICLQAEILTERLTFLGVALDEERTLSDEEVRHLQSLHAIHQDIQEYVSELSDAFSSLLLTQLANSTFGISFELLLITTVENPNYGMYQVLATWIIQILIWSYFGEQARSKVNNILYALYDNQWYNLKLTTKRSLIIMMSFTQKSYSFNNGWFHLTLATFISIMRSAYSYYAVMNK